MRRRVAGAVITVVLLAAIGLGLYFALRPAGSSGRAGADAATSSSTTESTAPPTTVRAIVPNGPPQSLKLASKPTGARLTITLQDGSTVTGTTPFSEQVPGGNITVSLAKTGYNTAVRELALDDAQSITMWLDPKGLLHESLVRFKCGPQPKQVVFSPDGKELWVSLLAGHGIEVFDPTTGTKLDQVALGEYGSVELVFNRAGTRLYVSQMETASVYELDPATRKVLRVFKTGGTWTKVLLLSPDEKTLWASNWSSNDVSEIDLETGKMVRRIKTVANPRGLYETPDGKRLFVAGFKNGDIQRIDLATGKGTVIFKKAGGSMRHMVVDEQRGVLYVDDLTTNVVWVMDLATEKVTKLADTDQRPNTIALSPDREGAVRLLPREGQSEDISHRGSRMGLGPSDRHIHRQDPRRDRRRQSVHRSGRVPRRQTPGVLGLPGQDDPGVHHPGLRDPGSGRRGPGRDSPEGPCQGLNRACPTLPALQAAPARVTVAVGRADAVRRVMQPLWRRGSVVRSKHSSSVVLKVEIASAVVLALILILVIGAQAMAAPPDRVTDNGWMDAYAEVSGDRIVWLGIPDPDFPEEAQVYTWTPTEGVTHLSTSSTLNQWPMVSGDRVVWFGAGGTDAGDDNEVFTWTPTGGLVQLTTDDRDEQGVRVSGDRVVWMGNDDAWVYQVFTWTPSGAPTQVSDDEVGAYSPVVSGDRDIVGQRRKGGVHVDAGFRPRGSEHHRGRRFQAGSVCVGGPAGVEMRWPGLHMDLGGGLRRVDQRPEARANLTSRGIASSTTPGWTMPTSCSPGPRWAAPFRSPPVPEGASDYRVSGDRIVWQPYSADTMRVLSWTPGGGTTEIAADSSGAAVSGDRVVWCSGEGDAKEIYTAVYTVTAPTRYEQTDGHIIKSGTWTNYSAPLASGQTYGRSSTSGASATIWFTGTKIAWIGMTGGTPGIVDVSIDGELMTTLDLYSSPAQYQVALYTSDALSSGVHHMDLVRHKNSLASEYLVLDAVDIWGTIAAAPPTITSLSPAAGSIDGGTSVTINGTNFVDISGPGAVTFDGANATDYVVNSATRITAVAPAHDAGAVTVRVTTPSGSATSSFTYAETPATTRLDVVNTTALVTPGTAWSGTWASYTSASAFSGSYMRSSTAGAYAVIAFNGTQLDWVSMKGTTGAKADIYVDGSPTKAMTVDCYASSPVYQQTLFTTGPLADGYHTVKIVRSTASASGRYLTIDAVDVAGTLLAPVRFEETDAHFTWNPAMTSWTLGSTASASGGTYRYKNTAGAYVSFDFTGVGFKLIAKTAPNYGNLTVTIDGVSQTVSLYSSATTYKKVVLTKFLAPGAHTVKIARAGTKSSSSSGYTIDLDAIDLFGEW